MDEEIIFMLTDDEFYKEISKYQDKKAMQKIKHLLLEYMDTTSFTKKETEFLTDFEFRESVFMVYPKYTGLKL
jgi:hypothetical protein